MKHYFVKLNRPEWIDEPATNRQLKVIRFFGEAPLPGITKGRASGICFRYLKDDQNRDLWRKYVYFTNDETADSPDLKPYEIAQLKSVKVPEDWHPATSLSRRQDDVYWELANEIISEGSPFDDPVPLIVIPNHHFAFTGKFSSGTRHDCQSVTTDLGGIFDDDVKLSTDYLVVGNEGNSQWAESSHGRKIQKAIIQKMKADKPIVISEADWITALQRSG